MSPAASSEALSEASSKASSKADSPIRPSPFVRINFLDNSRMTAPRPCRGDNEALEGQRRATTTYKQECGPHHWRGYGSGIQVVVAHTSCR